MQIIHFFKQHKMLSISAIVVFQVILAFFIGARDESIGNDTYRYAELYQTLRAGYGFDGGVEIGFQLFGYLFAFADMSNSAYFTGISLLLFLLLNITSLKFADFFKQTITKYSTDYWILICLVTFIFLLSPFFVSAHINAIRQGLASFLVYLSLFFFISKNWKLFVLTAALAISFHHTAIMYLALFPLLLLSVSYMLLIITLLSISYLSGFSEILVSYLSHILGTGIYEKINNYQSHVNYQRGIRLGFTIFSLALALIPALIYHYLASATFKNGLAKVLKVYLLLLIPFLLFGFASFSNRFLYTAWLFLPFLAVATLFATPILNKWKIRILSILIPVSSTLFVLMIMNGFAR